MGNGAAVVVWEDNRGGATSDIYAQYYDANGTAKWTANGVVVCNAPANQLIPTVVPDGAGGVFVAWEDRRNGNTNADLYVQRLSAAGQPLWAANGLVVSSAANSQTSPNVVADASSNVIFAWEDYRNSFSNGGIFAFKVMADGSYPRSQPEASFSSSTVAFGSVPVGIKRDKVITITNIGSDPLQISNITSTHPDFVPRPTIGTIASGLTFNDTIRFTPSGTGTINASIIVLSNSWTSPDTIRVTGVGAGTAVLALSATGVGFGAVKMGLKQDSVVVFSNTGVDTLRITGVNSSNSAFSAAQKVMNIPPGASVNNTITFTPKAIGKVNARFLVVSNALDSPDTLFVNGIGFGEVEILISPDRISFGKSPVGRARDTVLSIKNNGNDSLRVTEITSDEASFTALPSAFTVPAGGTAPLTVRFTPDRIGQINGELWMYSNSASNPDKIIVGGTGDADVLFSSYSVNFSTASIGMVKDTVVTLTNRRSDTLRVTDVTSDEGAFAAVEKTYTVAPSATVNVTLRFAPTKIGLVNGTLSFISNSATSPDRIAVNGEGLLTNAMEGPAASPSACVLSRNYPNPFAEQTVIPYELRQRSRVTLTVENVLGQRVATLVDQMQEPGMYRPVWHAVGLPNGMYRAVLHGSDRVSTESLLLLR
ncbi:MAG: choice-of-anchor D domain-containing protein [Ignavibacteria bacterium]|nr:choice-of-anchor D domain-containing protein [Ignavibacteria bacterium]